MKAFYAGMRLLFCAKKGLSKVKILKILSTVLGDRWGRGKGWNVCTFKLQRQVGDEPLPLKSIFIVLFFNLLELNETKVYVIWPVLPRCKRLQSQITLAFSPVQNSLCRINLSTVQRF